MSTWKQFVVKKDQLNEGLGDVLKSGLNKIRGKRADGVDAKLVSGHPTPEIWGSMQVDIFNKAYRQFMQTGFSQEEAASHAVKEVEAHMQTASKMRNWNVAAKADPKPVDHAQYGNAMLMGRHQRPEGIRDGGSPAPLPPSRS